MNLINVISPIMENRVYNKNNSYQSNNSSFNHDINNILYINLKNNILLLYDEII